MLLQCLPPNVLGTCRTQIWARADNMLTSLTASRQWMFCLCVLMLTAARFVCVQVDCAVLPEGCARD